MLSLVFLGMLVTAGSSQGEMNCSVPIYRICEGDFAMRLFPKNETEMHDVCEYMLNYLECAKNLSETCEEHSSELHKFTELLSVAEDVCNENNSIHRAIADHLPCISELASQPELCHPPVTRRKVANYAESLKEQGIPHVGITEGVSYICISHLNAFACSVAAIGKECSKDARNALIEMFQRLIVPGGQCREELIEHVPAIVALFEVEEEEAQEEVENIE